MILRRLTDPMKTQNWFAAAIDFVIVVAALTPLDAMDTLEA
jgi:hypothetical protein